VRTESPSRQLLVISESYHDGWVVWEEIASEYVQSALIPVYGDLMGCVVEAGKHELVIKFNPESLGLGKLLTGFGVLLTILCSAVPSDPVRRWLNRKP
jgi:hypothetical protein